jgi:hypothetical protein
MGLSTSQVIDCPVMPNKALQLTRRPARALAILLRSGYTTGSVLAVRAGN